MDGGSSTSAFWHEAEKAKAGITFILLWGYLHATMLHGQARAVGFGPPHIEQIEPGAHNVLKVVRYVCGQTESVFGSREHERHQDRQRWGRSFIHSGRATLKARNHKLLSALDLAQDGSVSDFELLERLPRFIRDIRTERWIHPKEAIST